MKIVAVLLSFTVCVSQSFASGAAPAKTPHVEVDLSPVSLNPSSLKEILLQHNGNIVGGQISLQQSKLTYSLAKSKLIPSLNVGAIAGSMANPSMLIPAVDVLLPFLIPDNWFNMASARRQYQADREAFTATRKDVLAGALSLYYSVLRDRDLLNVFRRDFEDLSALEDAVARRHSFGLASDVDLNRAGSQRALAKVRLLQTQQHFRNQEFALKSWIRGERSSWKISFHRLLTKIWPTRTYYRSPGRKAIRASNLSFFNDQPVTIDGPRFLDSLAVPVFRRTPWVIKNIRDSRPKVFLPVVRLISAIPMFRKSNLPVTKSR
jgi:hypothetical protein